MEAATTTTRPQLREHTLVHFEIPTNDPAKVSRFYEQLFGWKFSKMPAGDMDYWLISHKDANRDRKSTRLNSSHLVISYAVFCLKKKKKSRIRASQPARHVSLQTTSYLTVCCMLLPT